MVYGHCQHSHVVFTHGANKQAPLNVAGQQVAINICYEDVFGEELIWCFTASRHPRQSIEYGLVWPFTGATTALADCPYAGCGNWRPMLRATNTGMTAVIEANGNIQSAASGFHARCIERAVSPIKG